MKMLSFILCVYVCVGWGVGGGLYMYFVLAKIVVWTLEPCSFSRLVSTTLK